MPFQEFRQMPPLRHAGGHHFRKDSSCGIERNLSRQLLPPPVIEAFHRKMPDRVEGRE
jgi:hypothetical protein